VIESEKVLELFAVISFSDNICYLRKMFGQARKWWRRPTPFSGVMESTPQQVATPWTFSLMNPRPWEHGNHLLIMSAPLRICGLISGERGVLGEGGRRHPFFGVTSIILSPKKDTAWIPTACRHPQKKSKLFQEKMEKKCQVTTPFSRIENRKKRVFKKVENRKKTEPNMPNKPHTRTMTQNL